jgi:hypothetical protein
MTQDDAAANKARAERLRKQIRELTGSDDNDEATSPENKTDASGTAGSSPKGTASTESPRDFIQRRMRQIEENEEDPSQ